jgi:GNAT superfamily N-acetyltransferase
MKMKPEIRLMDAADVYAVKELAKHIWDGDDYLGKVAKHWLEDGGFLGMFDGEALIGCSKITRLPDRVIWLEGLRIHPDYRAKGLGKQLSATSMDIALNLVSSGEADHIEFSTYYLNEESIHIATQAGFRQIDELYIMSHKSVKPKAEIRHTRIHEDITDYFPASIPYGWKFLHPVKPSLNWLNKKSQLHKVEFGYFYVGGEQPTVCLLSPAGDWIAKALPVMQYFIGKKEPIELILHSSRKFEIEILQSMDFHWWEEGKEDRILVYRYFPE